MLVDAKPGVFFVFLPKCTLDLLLARRAVPCVLYTGRYGLFTLSTLHIINSPWHAVFTKVKTACSRCIKTYTFVGTKLGMSLIRFYIKCLKFICTILKSRSSFSLNRKSFIMSIILAIIIDLLRSLCIFNIGISYNESI